MNVLNRPEPLEPGSSALFLDLDGTLIGFGATPMAVEIPHTLAALLAAWRIAGGGALALVSGRRIETLDALLAPVRLPAAGLHGLERRDAHGRMHRIEGIDAALHDTVLAALAAFARRDERMLVENKGIAMALHFRNAPAQAAAVAAFADDLESRLPPQLVLQRGHMVVEIRPAGADKGSAIEAFMAEPPFCGRRPVFIGDDRTDEHGFAVVNAQGGLTVKVGEGATAAVSRLPDPPAVLAWLGAGLAGRPRTDG